jgi:trans-2-enoyl-CoA reductase
MDSSFVITRSAASQGINLYTTSIPLPTDAEVLVRFYFSPINPLDLAVIAGVYPVKPHFEHDGESILGFDAIGEVVSLGPNVKHLQVGDFVVPAKYGIGTWRSHALIDEALLDKIPRPNGLRFGAILRLGVTTAYFLVEGMCRLRPGDWIIQNAGTSVVAQMVVQFARRRGVNVLSVIRDRHDASSIIETLSAAPAGMSVIESMVVTESQLGEAKEGNKFTMAIDSVGGFSGQQILACLTTGGTFVQHGFLSGTEQILPMNAASFWVRHLTMVSSRSSAQMAALTEDERRHLFAWFVELFNRGELQLPGLGLQEIAFDTGNTEESKKQLELAISRAKKGKLGQRKQVIVWG